MDRKLIAKYMNLISVIIPVYNHFTELKQALQSLKKQTYNNIEVIIVDDGSDEPVENKINKNDFNFDIVCVREENRGAPFARNKGFEVSKGDFVIFWDADVIGSPEMLAKMHNVLSIHPEASYVYSDFYYGKKAMVAGKFDSFRLKRENYIMTTSLMRRNDFLYFDKNLKRFQDWDLWLTMLERDKVGIYIPEFLFFVIPHKNGISFWLPSFAYKKPFSWLPMFRQKVKDYEAAKKIIMEKHGLLSDKTDSSAK